jgi:hypothetical protein
MRLLCERLGLLCEGAGLLCGEPSFVMPLVCKTVQVSAPRA